MDLVFSDIHADLSGLDLIIQTVSSDEFVQKYGSFSRIINLGDLLERGVHPKQVISKLRLLEKNYPIFSVIGNHDEGFLSGKKVSASSLESMDAHERLGVEDLSFFKQNKDGTFGNQEFIDAKNGLFCVHGGPLDPKKITPRNVNSEAWLYQRNWQRLTDEGFEFFSYHGYHYKASSAFGEVGKHVRNHIILCGHQHMEAALVRQAGKIREIYSKLEPKKEKISGHVLESKEIEINPTSDYLIRLGLGGPAGYYGVGSSMPHFAIIQYNPKKVILFTVNP
ncbi:MAG: metallophosphoesterase [Candidatus Nitrosotalea sp.]|nr:metallophosphoesterase [Candidatus Nitrosotalea sp.]